MIRHAATYVCHRCGNDNARELLEPRHGVFYCGSSVWSACDIRRDVRRSQLVTEWPTRRNWS